MKGFAVALLLIPLAAQAQMRCADGSYQASCPGGEPVGGSISTYSAPSVSSPPPLARPQPRQAPRPTQQRARDTGISRNDLVKARNRGIILMGMAERDVTHILGKPDLVNVETNGASTCRHLHWRDGYVWKDYVRICGGKTDYHRDRYEP